jgi:protein gp37
LDLQLPVQSVPITTKVVSSNPVLGEVDSIEHYVIKFVSVLEEVGGFFPGTTVSSINKTDCHEITETLLKVALNTINQLNQPTIFSGIKKFTLYYST